MILALVIFATVFFLLVAFRRKKEEKREALNSRIAGEELEREKEQKKARKRKPLHLYLEELGGQAGIRRTQTEWLLIAFSTLIGGVLLGVLLGVGWFLTIVFGAGAIGVLVLYLKWRKQKYFEAFRYGLQDLTEYGVSLFQVSPDMEPLLREVVKNSKNKVLVQECKEILREVDVLGNPPLKVMQKRAKESGVSEYLLLVEMTMSALDTKSSLVTIYKDLNTTIRRYYGVEKKILSKTSGMRKVGFALAFLPFPMFAFFWSSIKPMLHGGIQILFYIVIGTVMFGAYVLNRVVKVRV